MSALVELLFGLALDAYNLAKKGDDPEAERQVLLNAQRKISDELARREYAPPTGG